ncbi:MAG: hypothetical protein B7Y35_06295 [Sphingomonadales bacterium 28-64-96]|nr:MAG: hypothetical protein B7Y35_06295 [Sphingomonadales bacterium 28-64-96]
MVANDRVCVQDCISLVGPQREQSVHNALHDDFEHIRDIRKILRHADVNVSLPPFAPVFSHLN